MVFRRLERCIFAISVMMFLVTFAVIFALTVQQPQETSSLSERVEHKLTPVKGAPADESPLTAGKAAVRSAASHLFSIAHVRKWAHTGEFFALGLSASLAALTWPHRSRRRAAFLLRRALAALGVCVACSLFDQTHKLIVPGRHFDATDLIFDAMGYGLAIIAVFVFAGLSSRLRDARESRPV